MRNCMVISLPISVAHTHAMPRCKGPIANAPYPEPRRSAFKVVRISPTMFESRRQANIIKTPSKQHVAAVLLKQHTLWS